MEILLQLGDKLSLTIEDFPVYKMHREKHLSILKTF